MTKDGIADPRRDGDLKPKHRIGQFEGTYVLTEAFESSENTTIGEAHVADDPGTADGADPCRLGHTEK